MTWDGVNHGAVGGRLRVVLRDVSIYKVEFQGRANEDVDMTEGEKPHTAEESTNPLMTRLEIHVNGALRDVRFDVKPYKPR